MCNIYSVLNGYRSYSGVGVWGIELQFTSQYMGLKPYVDIQKHS